MATINSIISLTDNMSDKLDAIRGNVDKLITTMDNVNNTKWDTFITNAEKAGEDMKRIGKSMTAAITLPSVFLGKKLYNNATEYESAWTGVTKTVDATEEEYEQLYNTILQKSEQMPVAATAFMGVTQAAGQAGVALNELDKFGSTFAKIEVSTNIQGEKGVKQIARILNLTEKSTENVDRFGSTIVDLGNKFAADEDEILQMSYRLAATGSLADFTTAQILGLSTAFTSMGINAEAGGSAASKLMKQMQLASEVGENAESLLGADYGSALDFSYFISSKENLLGVAQDLNVTTEYIQQLGQTWLDLENFAKVSGKTADQFIKDWDDNPAQGMLDFFAGLGELDQSGQESAIAMMNEMGLTEIRLSNLIAASGFNSELVKNAIAIAEEAYAANVALDQEYDKFAGTQESKNQMLWNKLNNSMADLGQNLVSAVQPALDKVNELVTAFNGLSEADQDKIITAFGVFAIGGPVVTAIGGTITAIGKIGEAITKLTSGSFGASMVSFFSGPAGWVTLGVAAVGTLIGVIDSIPSKTESIIQGLVNIPITIDEGAYNEIMGQIDALQARIDELRNNPEEMANLQKTSASVMKGFGTNNMYSDALVYEATMFEDQYESVVNDYTARIAEATQNIVDAEDDATALYWRNQVEQMELQRDDAINGAKQAYAANVSDLYNGMMAEDAELKSKLERAAQQYDLASAIQQMYTFDWGDDTPEYFSMGWDERADFDQGKQAEFDQIQEGIFGVAKALGYLDKMDMNGISALDQIGNYALFFDTLREQLATDMSENVQSISDNPIVNSWLQSILDSPAIAENLDLTKLQGALDGVYKMLDFRQAGENAAANGEEDNWGAYLTQNLADSIIAGTPTIVGAITSMGTQMQSTMGTAASQTQMAAEAHLNSATGSSAASNYGAGAAAGALSKIGAMYNAGYRLGAALNAGYRAATKTASPSRVAMEYGGYYVDGLVEGILSNVNSVSRAVGKVTQAAIQPMNAGIWSLIGDYNGLELASMQDPDNTEIKISDADLKKVRQLAEREIINQFTTVELKIEYTNNNNINNDLDVDDLFDQFGDRLAERVEMVAGGVYEG